MSNSIVRKNRCMKYILRLVGMLLSIWTLTGHAETWRDIESEPGKYFFQVDIDSVVPFEEGRYTASWRSGSTIQRPYFVNQGSVNCLNESLVLSTSRYVETDPILAKYRGADQLIDY